MHRADRGDDQGGRGRRPVHRQGGQDDDLRGLRRADQGHRRPAPHLQRQARRAGRARSRTCSSRATSSTSPWSRWTASAAASACGSPTTPRSRARAPEELTQVGTGDPGPRRRPRRRRRRAASAWTAARRGGRGGVTASAAADADRLSRRDASRGRRAHRAAAGVRVDHRGGALGALGGARALGAHRLARRGAGPGGRLALPRAPAVQGHRAPLGDRDLGAVRRHGRRRSTPRPARRSTHLHARLPRRAHRGAPSTCWPRCCSAPTYPDEVDSEREVVLEEIAMYEDEPQDRVHDVLADAVFGDHPLGRRVLGEAEVIALDPGRRRSTPTTRPATRRRTSSSPPPATSSTSGSSSWPSASCAARRASSTAARRRRAPTAQPRFALPREGDRAVPHLLRRRRGSPARTSGASRSACSTRSSAARPPRACSARSARSAASPTRSAPTASSTWTRGMVAMYVGTREDNVARGLRDHRRASCASLRDRGRHRRGAGARQGARQGTDRARPRVDRGADDAARPRDALRRARCSRSTRCWRGSTR